MATNEKNQQPKKQKKLLKIGLIILGVGLLGFGGTLAIGLITLARDLLYTVVFAETLLVGGSLGKKAADGVSNWFKNRKSKSLQRQRSKELGLEVEETLESLPIHDVVRNSDLSVSKQEVANQKNNRSR